MSQNIAKCFVTGKLRGYFYKKIYIAMSVTLLLSFLLSMFANQAAYNAIDNPGQAQGQVQSENLRKIITDDDGG